MSSPKMSSIHTQDLLQCDYSAYLVDIPKVIPSGGLTALSASVGGFLSLTRMSCVALKCCCSGAVVRPERIAPLFRATKSFPGGGQ